MKKNKVNRNEEKVKMEGIIKRSNEKRKMTVKECMLQHNNKIERKR